MKRAITFDTNILRKYKYFENIKKEISRLSQFGDIYITEVVLDELAKHFSSELHEKVVANSSTLEAIGFGIDIPLLTEEIKSMKAIKETITSIFNSKVILRNNVSLDQVYERAIIKIPPFDEKKTSDKGFKDSVLWFSILNADFDAYDEFIFISSDGGFSKQDKFLGNEFEKKKSLNIKFFQNILQFDEYVIGIENAKSEIVEPSLQMQSDGNDTDNIKKPSNITDTYKIMTEYRQGLHDLMKKVFYVDDGDDYHFDYKPRFSIHESIDIPSLDDFINTINNVIDSNLFNVHINPYMIFQSYISHENFKSIYQLNTESLIELLEYLFDFRDEVPQYSKSFINSITTMINDDFFVYDFSKDLPF